MRPPAPNPGTFRVEALGPEHNRAEFSCGIEPLDRYLQQQAGQDAKRRVALPFVLTQDGKDIAGYYTLSQYAVALVDLPPDFARKLPRYPLIPATLIGRLAVSLAFRGRGLGEILLMDALFRSLQGSRKVASAAVVVDAKNEAAMLFYRKYGFSEFPSQPNRLFLAMKTVEHLFPGD